MEELKIFHLPLFSILLSQLMVSFYKNLSMGESVNEERPTDSTKGG